MPRIIPTDNALEAGEMHVWVTYDNAPDGSYYPELQNGYRGSIWGNTGYAAAIMFVDIPDNSLLPGQTKRVSVYTLSPANFAQWIVTEKIYWGPLKRAIGTLSLFSPSL
jgi:hypothetical protein